jgi:iron complex outermembrane receptor protein
VTDFQLYNKEDTISTYRFIGHAEYEHKFASRVLARAGVNYMYITPEVHSYSEDIHEHRTDVFASSVVRYIKNGKISVNIRNSYVSDYSPELSPSLGMHQLFWLNEHSSLNMSISVSRSYKIPTFNNRYWHPWGNPDLKTEKGINYGYNVGHLYKWGNSSLTTDLSLYTMMIDDWIKWVPVSSDVWRPINFRKVHSRGFEISTGYKFEMYDKGFGVSVKYAFNRSEPVRLYSENDHELGKQLPYSPVHTGLVYGNINLKNWQFNTDVSYTGERNNSTLDRILPGYFLVNVAVERKIIVRKSLFLVSFHVNNVLNNYYINIENYAMPGINWKSGIKYNFNKPFKNSKNAEN